MPGINSCILSSINFLTRNSNNQILSFDFVGNSGYMTQMCCYEDVMFSQKITDIYIPTDAFELDSLKKYIEIFVFMEVTPFKVICYNKQIFIQ